MIQIYARVRLHGNLKIQTQEGYDRVEISIILEGIIYGDDMGIIAKVLRDGYDWHEFAPRATHVGVSTIWISFRSPPWQSIHNSGHRPTVGTLVRRKFLPLAPTLIIRFHHRSYANCVSSNVHRKYALKVVPSSKRMRELRMAGRIIGARGKAQVEQRDGSPWFWRKELVLWNPRCWCVICRYMFIELEDGTRKIWFRGW